MGYMHWLCHYVWGRHPTSKNNLRVVRYGMSSQWVHVQRVNKGVNLTLVLTVTHCLHRLFHYIRKVPNEFSSYPILTLRNSIPHSVACFVSEIRWWSRITAAEPSSYFQYKSWWRHQMEFFFALLASCAGNSPVTGEFTSQKPMSGSFDVFFDLRLK